MAQYTKLDSSSQGRLGGAYVSGTGVNTGTYGAIHALTTCTFTTLTGNITSAVSITLPAGDTIIGYFTVVTLASGTAILYNAD